MNLVVSECFYSIQGEGQTMGYPAVFLRLSGCNILCQSDSWICDTIDVWRKGIKTPFDKVLSDESLNALKNGAHLIFTGGEPMLHQKSIIRYLDWFKSEFSFLPTTEIETNGTIMPIDKIESYINIWNCSPKLSNSGVDLDDRFVPQVIGWLNSLDTSIFKFVIEQKKDVDEMLDTYGLVIAKKKVVLMPAGEDQQQLNNTRTVVLDCCKKYHLRYCDRLHVVAWNLKTGV
jgi:organic radical activating enzyme